MPFISQPYIASVVCVLVHAYVRVLVHACVRACVKCVSAPSRRPKVIEKVRQESGKNTKSRK